MMNGYLFDLDGTLIQSMHVWEDAVMRLFDRLNLKMDIDEARDAFFSYEIHRGAGSADPAFSAAYERKGTVWHGDR